ncbi:MAG: hypothetical protein M3Q30_26305 [Actinomycetota bacterium]|nr:hypothetical protein [Actinomycetota bacterium]
MTVTSTDELYLELSALTSTDRKLTASEERRRSYIVRELAGRDNSRGRQVVDDRYAQWISLERAADGSPITKDNHEY